MTQAARQRAEIEGVVRAWFASMSPEDRREEGARLAGFVAARLSFFCGERPTAELLYMLADAAAAGPRPDGDPT